MGRRFVTEGWSVARRHSCAERESFEVFWRAGKYVEVHIVVDSVADAGDVAVTCVLAEGPVVASDAAVIQIERLPEGIVLEAVAHKALLHEVMIGIDDRDAVVVVTDQLEPALDLVAELSRREVAASLYVEHGRQVALVQMGMLDEIGGLVLGAAARYEIVVSAEEQPVTPCLKTIEVVVGVLPGAALCALGEGKTDGLAVQGRTAHFAPVHLALMMRHVDAVYLVVAGRVVALTVMAALVRTMVTGDGDHDNGHGGSKYP